MKILTGIIALALLAPTTFTFAQVVDVYGNASVRTDKTPVRAEVKAEIKTRTETRVMQMQANQESRSEQRSTVQARIQAHKANILTQRTELKLHLETSAKARIADFGNKFTARLDAAITRLESLENRVEAKIAEFEERGADVSNSVELLATAKVSLQTTKTEIGEAKIAIAAELEKDTVSRETIIAIMRTVQESMKKTHAAYVEVISSLRMYAIVESEI